MSFVACSHASLGFFGDDLDPDDLTARLGAAPDTWARKGEYTRSVRGRATLAPTGRWALGVEPREPGDPDGQIREVLSRLTPDLAVWQDLTRRYRCRLFVGLFMEVFNEGLELSAEGLGMLGARGVRLDLDIYGSENDPDGLLAGVAAVIEESSGRPGAGKPRGARPSLRLVPPPE